MPARPERGGGYFKLVQALVRRIPRGKIASYGGVARAAGFPGTARQVVWALRDAGSAGLPWHRVLGAGGRILLPGDAGAEQRLRLEAEGVTFSGSRARMDRHEWHVTAQHGGSSRGRRRAPKSRRSGAAPRNPGR